MYKFENANATIEYYMPSSNICSIYEFDENFEKNYVMALGQLKYLFGKPRYITNNLENQFSYIIKAINEENGDYLFLEVYCASSGPAIGGLNDSNSHLAAQELAMYIRQSPAVDYDYEGYYLDTMSKVHHSIQNGVPSWKETEISTKEFEDFTEEIISL
ncbi:hypothetical protein [Clostridium fessum]|uniref:hypothetical protein n=1 Tax=Clostridium fessum TaxID=2126740 RepID=UPI0022E917EB|nr:hypothetical protein [Clostridium fessum]